MNINEIKKTHSLITKTATIGTPGYAVLENGIISIWNGERSTGYYKVDENGELSKYNFLSDAGVEIEDLDIVE